MKRRHHIGLLCFAGVIGAGSCMNNVSTRNGGLSPGEVVDSVVLLQPQLNQLISNGDSLRAEFRTEQPDIPHSPVAGKRVLDEADKTYIDLIIPEYADVILWHEGNAETLNFTEEVYQYLLLKNANVKKKPVADPHSGTAQNKRLHIADVGENWYELYIFDEWE